MPLQDPAVEGPPGGKARLSRCICREREKERKAQAKESGGEGGGCEENTSDCRGKNGKRGWAGREQRAGTCLLVWLFFITRQPKGRGGGAVQVFTERTGIPSSPLARRGRRKKTKRERRGKERRRGRRQRARDQRGRLRREDAPDALVFRFFSSFFSPSSARDCLAVSVST